MRVRVSWTSRRATPGASCVRAFALALGALAALVAGPLAGGARAGVSAAPAPGQPPTIAYVTETATTLRSVWTISADGSQKTRIGPGDSPLISPNGEQVAAALFEPSEESGPGPVVYSTAGG